MEKKKTYLEEVTKNHTNNVCELGHCTAAVPKIAVKAVVSKAAESCGFCRSMRSSGWRRKALPCLVARAHSDLRNLPGLASCMLEGQLAFIGLFVDGLKRNLYEL